MSLNYTFEMLHSDEELMLEASMVDTLYGGQVTSLTQFMNDL